MPFLSTFPAMFHVKQRQKKADPFRFREASRKLHILSFLPPFQQQTRYAGLCCCLKWKIKISSYQ